MDYMSNPVRSSELETIALRHGRKRSAVRIAVNRGLIHKAERMGVRGRRGAGHAWLYPAGTDQALKLVFHLQDKGYRGSALRFRLWWDGAAPFSSAVPKYIAGVLSSPRRDIEAQLARTLSYGVLGYESSDDVDVDASGYVEEWFSPDTLRTLLDRRLSEVVLSSFTDVLRELDPSAAGTGSGTNGDLRSDQLGKIIRVFASTMMRVSPADIRANARDLLIAYLRSNWPENSDFPFDPEVIVDELHSPGWFDTLIAYVSTARPGGYEVARSVLQDDPYLSNVLNVLTEVLKGEIRQTRTMGEWRFPNTAVLAVVLGYLVGIAKWIQIKTGGLRSGSFQDQQIDPFLDNNTHPGETHLN
jgi:hypothetical protein